MGRNFEPTKLHPFVQFCERSVGELGGALFSSEGTKAHAFRRLYKAKHVALIWCEVHVAVLLPGSATDTLKIEHCLNHSVMSIATAE